MTTEEQAHQSVRTLSRWVDRVLRIPSTIECPTMEIIGRDFEPPLFSGPGHIEILSRTRIGFVMHATPADGGEAFKRIVRAQKNPYNIRDQFRIVATAYDGTEWNGGWTHLDLGETTASVWRISGSIRSLMTDVSGRWVSKEPGVEVVYDSKLRLPIPMNMVTSIKRADREVFWSRGPGSKSIEVVGTHVEFFHAPEGNIIWAKAHASKLFPHPYAENWISEPLSLLLGQLVFPRLVARNFGGGKAIVWLRPSPTHNAFALTSSILEQDSYLAGDHFWEMYSDILTMIVHARDKSGEPNFESHPLTQYYHEIIQASTGSHWVLCMTLASVVEGVSNLMFTSDERKSDFQESDLKSIKRHVELWEGDKLLKQRIVNSVAHAETKGIVQSLKALAKNGAITKLHIDTWQSVRNQVMHGVLVSPWSTQELDERIHSLIELVHRISTAYIRKCVALSSMDDQTASDSSAGDEPSPDSGAKTDDL